MMRRTAPNREDPTHPLLVSERKLLDPGERMEFVVGGFPLAVFFGRLRKLFPPFLVVFWGVFFCFLMKSVSYRGSTCERKKMETIKINFLQHVLHIIEYI